HLLCSQKFIRILNSFIPRTHTLSLIHAHIQTPLFLSLCLSLMLLSSPTLPTHVHAHFVLNMVMWTELDRATMRSLRLQHSCIITPHQHTTITTPPSTPTTTTPPCHSLSAASNTTHRHRMAAC